MKLIEGTNDGLDHYVLIYLENLYGSHCYGIQIPHSL